MAANQRIERWADSIVDTLALRLGGAPTKSYDANKDCWLTFPTGNLMVKFEVETAGANGKYDSLGLPQTVYAPHVVKILFDTGVTNGGGAAATEKEKFLATAEAVQTGARVQLYAVDAGAVALAQSHLATAALQAEFQSDWGLIANV